MKTYAAWLSGLFLGQAIERSLFAAPNQTIAWVAAGFFAVWLGVVIFIDRAARTRRVVE